MRLRLTAPRGGHAKFRFLDSLHSALVNAWTACGASGTQVVGQFAENWSFGAVGSATTEGFILKSVVIGSGSEQLDPILARIAPETVRKSSPNGDELDLTAWRKVVDEFPVIGVGSSAVLPAIMLSPLALSVRGRKGRWYSDLTVVGENLEAAVNFRLSRLVNREVKLKILPDRLYLRANSKHATLVRLRKTRNGSSVFVVGMMCPLTLNGSIDDLRAAWNLGIGEKNRYGFGCIGYAGERL